VTTLLVPRIASNGLDDVLAQLSPAERYVLRRRLHPSAPSFAEIGADMRVSRQRVAQLEASALYRLGAAIPSLAVLQRDARPCVARRDAAAAGLRCGREKVRIRKSSLEAAYDRAVDALLADPCGRNEVRATRLARLCIAA
jgi:hypothetical protein